MFSLKQAKRHAQNMASLHKEPWVVGLTPDTAQCNQPGFDTFNEGRFIAIRSAEMEDYAAGGMTFPRTSGELIQFNPT